jgi:RNA polymerase sigma-70 factor (ECF subfamily)
MEQSVSMLLVEHLDPIRNFARKLTRSNGADAEELLQDTCERILLRAHQYQPGTRFKSWACSIMHSIWVEDIRRSARRGPVGSIETLPPYRVATDEPRRGIEKRLEMADTARACNDLSQEMQSVIWYIACEGLSYKETAAAAGIPLGTVMSRLNRAREALTRKLGESLAA